MSEKNIKYISFTKEEFKDLKKELDYLFTSYNSLIKTTPLLLEMHNILKNDN